MSNFNITLDIPIEKFSRMSYYNQCKMTPSSIFVAVIWHPIQLFYWYFKGNLEIDYAKDTNRKVIEGVIIQSLWYDTSKKNFVSVIWHHIQPFYWYVEGNLETAYAKYDNRKVFKGVIWQSL